MENPTMSPGSTVMGVLSASTVPPTPMSLNCAGIRADVMLVSLQATLVPAPTNTGGVTKSPANPVEATESTATRARIERTMTVSSFGAHDARCDREQLEWRDAAIGVAFRIEDEGEHVARRLHPTSKAFRAAEQCSHPVIGCRRKRAGVLRGQMRRLAQIPEGRRMP